MEGGACALECMAKVARSAGRVQARSSSFWRSRPVLVTGGAGFIGYALATRLGELGARVVVLDIKKGLPPFTLGQRDMRRRITYVRGSVTSKKTIDGLLKRYRIRSVFHLAAEAIVSRAFAQPARALDTNARGTWVLLECIRHASSASEVVVASSDKAYGSHARLPYREEAPLQGSNPYDVSKSATDLIAQMYAHAYGMPIAVARCGNVYGPGDMHWSRLIPDALRSVARGRTLGIRSDGTFKRDYNYVDDIVDAYLILAQRLVKDDLQGEAFNFGEGKPRKVLEILRELSRVAPSLQYKILNTVQGEIHDQYLDSSKARRQLRWRHRVSMRDGLKRTATWYAQYFKSV